MTLRGLFRFKPRACARRCRSTRSSRSARSSSASPPARCPTARSRGGARDARHRDEPARRQVQHRRGRRGPGALRAAARPDSAQRAIKQVASGRFGVTSEYLVNADDIQIKMAQGAKPGEGGQLPGHKVYPWIAKTRHSTPGVGLISPAAAPRHLLDRGPRPAHPRPQERQPAARGPRQARRRGRRRHGRRRRGQGARRRRPHLRPRRRHRRLAADLAQARRCPLGARPGRDPADAAAQRLRDRVVVQTDGQLKTGRDVVIAALLGAEEYGFATAPLVVMGCVMMRVCHLDTCPVGVATQNPELRERGSPASRSSSSLLRVHRRGGARAPRRARLPQPRGGDRPRRDARHRRAVDHWKASGLDLTPDPARARAARGRRLRRTTVSRTTASTGRSTTSSSSCAADAIERGEPVRAQLPVRNVNRTVGTMLGPRSPAATAATGCPTAPSTSPSPARPASPSARSSRRHHAAPRGRRQRLRRQGPVRRSGRRAARPGRGSRRGQRHRRQRHRLRRDRGELFVRGVVGERFCVRNSGATPSSRAWATTAAST
jgi:glutamate synthase (NADPH) large chain